MKMTEKKFIPGKHSELRGQVEDFVFYEAALLDQWELDKWLALFADKCRYEVAPTGIENPLDTSMKNTLFLIGDDRYRLEQRVIRMKKTTAHVEYPHSRTRHLYSNVRILSASDGAVNATLSFVTFRTKRGVTTNYMGCADYVLQRQNGSFLISSKRIGLDLDSLVPQGKVSVFL
jgi:p-cumate 2,3-dioxygenase subunit beta